MFKLNKIEKIIDQNLCVGCGLCAGLDASKNIYMDINTEGFSRPVNVQNLNYYEVDLVESCCPGVQYEYLDELSKTKGDSNYDSMWGRYEDVLTGHSTNEKVRHLGSSGGVITELAIQLLSQGIVKAVVLSKKSDIDPLGVEVIIAKTYDEVMSASGSKYCVSPTLSVINQIEEFDGKIAFVGKPCDVAGLRLLARKNSRLASKIKYYISFFCAGIPSTYATKSLLDKMSVSYSSVSDFWYRGKGWPGKSTAITSTGDRYELDYKEAWGKILSKDLQFRCKICADGIGEFADVVVGDAWECDEKGYPVFEDSEGASIIIARTYRGSNLISLMRDKNLINASSLDIRTIDNMQPGQMRKRNALFPRYLALKIGFRKTPNLSYRTLFLNSRNSSVIEFVTGFFGMLRRLVK